VAEQDSSAKPRWLAARRRPSVGEGSTPRLPAAAADRAALFRTHVSSVAGRPHGIASARTPAAKLPIQPRYPIHRKRIGRML